MKTLYFLFTFLMTFFLFAQYTEQDKEVIRKYEKEPKLEEYYKDKNLEKNFQGGDKTWGPERKELIKSMLLNWGRKEPKLGSEGTGYYKGEQPPQIYKGKIIFTIPQLDPTLRSSSINNDEFNNKIKDYNSFTVNSNETEIYKEKDFWKKKIKEKSDYNEKNIQIEFEKYCEKITGIKTKDKKWGMFSFGKKGENICEHDPVMLDKGHNLKLKRYKEMREIFVQRCLTSRNSDGTTGTIMYKKDSEPYCKLNSLQAPEGVYVSLYYDIQTNILGKDTDAFRAWCHWFRHADEKEKEKKIETARSASLIDKCSSMLKSIGKKNEKIVCIDNNTKINEEKKTPCNYYDFITNLKNRPAPETKKLPEGKFDVEYQSNINVQVKGTEKKPITTIEVKNTQQPPKKERRPPEGQVSQPKIKVTGSENKPITPSKSNNPTQETLNNFGGQTNFFKGILKNQNVNQPNSTGKVKQHPSVPTNDSIKGSSNRTNEDQINKDQPDGSPKKKSYHDSTNIQRYNQKMFFDQSQLPPAKKELK